MDFQDPLSFCIMPVNLGRQRGLSTLSRYGSYRSVAATALTASRLGMCAALPAAYTAPKQTTRLCSWTLPHQKLACKQEKSKHDCYYEDKDEEKTNKSNEERKRQEADQIGCIKYIKGRVGHIQAS
jgi:hypothetical protein